MAFTKVASVADVPPGVARQVHIGKRTIGIYNVGGTYYAIEDICPHRGATLSEGDVEGTEVTCPWHGARFDLRSGANLCPPARSGVPSYPVQVVGDEIQVDVP
jgi:nitrite reductase/ring-hydroxylating ferredoxin subunit